jgi:molybdopterin synthase catalytic subunit
MADVVRLTAIRDSPLSVDEALAAVSDPSAGGVATFVGVVRDNADDGDPREVVALRYSAHPTAERILRETADHVASAYDVVALAATHRVGDLAVGDLAVVVAASAVHRAEAFAACRALIDDLKATVPIWKLESFADGSEDWVGAGSVEP